MRNMKHGIDHDLSMTKLENMMIYHPLGMFDEKDKDNVCNPML